MYKAVTVLAMLITSLLSGCWKPETEIISDPSIEPYSPGHLYTLSRDFFIIEANSGASSITSDNLLVGAGVSYGGRTLPSSGQEYDEAPSSYSEQIKGYLGRGTMLKYLHTAFVTDWYSNTNIYYGVFELHNTEASHAQRFMIRYGPLVPNKRFNRYPSIVDAVIPSPSSE